MRDFILENNITFGIGTRNSMITTLVGFAQFKGLDKDTLKKELTTEIKHDEFISEEIDRLWSYCKNKNYKQYWSTPEAKLRYIFI